MRALLAGLGERDWNAGGGGVPVALDVLEHLLGRQSQAFGHRVGDALVGLMRHHQRHLVEPKSGALSSASRITSGNALWRA